MTNNTNTNNTNNGKGSRRPNKPLTHKMDLEGAKAQLEQPGDAPQFDNADLSALVQAVEAMNSSYSEVSGKLDKTTASSEEVKAMVGGILPAVQAAAKSIQNFDELTLPQNLRAHAVSDRSKVEKLRVGLNENKFVGMQNGAVGIIEDAPVVGPVLKGLAYTAGVKLAWDLGKTFFGAEGDADAGDMPFEK